MTKPTMITSADAPDNQNSIAAGELHPARL